MRAADVTDAEHIARHDDALVYAPEAISHHDLERLAQVWRKRAMEAEERIADLERRLETAYDRIGKQSDLLTSRAERREA